MMCSGCSIIKFLQLLPTFGTTTTNRAFSMSAVQLKNMFDSTRQGKVFNKLYGQRITGQKKRFIPSLESNVETKTEHVFQGKRVQSKANLRRLAMLNKLFMEHITSLLAMGKISDYVLNKGMQVTRVKVSMDYAFINVYWYCAGDAQSMIELEQELRRCSGILRHELSQLELMGVVPRINFVADRLNYHIVQVDSILQELDPTFKDSTDDLAVMSGEYLDDKKDSFVLPKMTHDIFNLNHEEMYNKILTKMRKSKQAWDAYNEQTTSINIPKLSPETTLPQIPTAQFSNLIAKKRTRDNPSKSKQMWHDLHNIPPEDDKS